MTSVPPMPPGICDVHIQPGVLHVIPFTKRGEDIVMHDQEAVSEPGRAGGEHGGVRPEWQL